VTSRRSRGGSDLAPDRRCFRSVWAGANTTARAAHGRAEARNSLKAFQAQGDDQTAPQADSRRPWVRAETRSVKVCPHCAEELPDEATVCTQCHKDPAQAPAWATPRRPDEPPPWWSEDVLQPSRGPGSPDTVPARYRRMELAAGRGGSLGVPSKVWASIILGFGWGFVAGIVAGPLPLGARLIVLLSRIRRRAHRREPGSCRGRGIRPAGEDPRDSRDRLERLRPHHEHLLPDSVRLGARRWVRRAPAGNASRRWRYPRSPLRQQPQITALRVLSSSGSISSWANSRVSGCPKNSPIRSTRCRRLKPENSVPLQAEQRGRHGDDPAQRG
jgi:ribosomal protein L40E